MERLEHCHLVTELGELGGAGQSGGAGTDDRDFPIEPVHDDGALEQVVLHLVIGHEPFELADRHGLMLLPEHALGFALHFLRADPAADRRKVILFADFLYRTDIVFLDDFRDKGGNIHTDRAALHAQGIFALEAAVRLFAGARLVEAEADFLEVAAASFGVLFEGFLPGKSHSLLRSESVR
ncbi:MAG: hypothetical protein BWY66_00102 [bacterium ADurb.Bin374]|nr:MAG: hypothetical protein BWY66_00102 [bacterium ADurb.Bin374]